MKFISDISELYDLNYYNNYIASGGYGSVFKALDKKYHRKCALKIIHKDLIKKGNKNDYIKDNILRVNEIMKMCKSNNIFELYDSFETKNNYILVLEYCDIDLMSYVLKIKNIKEI